MRTTNASSSWSIVGRTPWGLALLGAVKLLCDQCAMPGEDGVRFDDFRHFRQRLLPQLLADLGEGLALAIAQAYTTFDLVAQDAIFGHQVLIAQQQCLIDSS